MAEIINRQYYDKKKKQHDGFKLFLNIMRIIGIALLDENVIKEDSQGYG